MRWEGGSDGCNESQPEGVEGWLRGDRGGRRPVVFEHDDEVALSRSLARSAAI